MTQEALKKMYQLLLTEPHAPTVCAKLEAIAREALAQPEQEPRIGCVNHDCDQCKAQRTEPAQQKKVWTFWDLSGGDITDAIKAKLKEKNT